MTGIFSRAKKGYGFIAEKGREGDDWYVPRGMGCGAATGDAVEFRAAFVSRRGDRKEAEVTRVLERASARAVGVYQKGAEGGRVIADKTGQEIIIPRRFAADAQPGHKCVCEIHKHPRNDDELPLGKITRIIGRVNDPGTDVLSVIERLEIPFAFPEGVMAETAGIPDEITASDAAGRRDLRGELMITIDGADAKDLDDAVSLTETPGGFRLGVHIADVAHYVRPGTALYAEALNRGTSCYLADRVIPMLPHKLSNGLCSLNPNKDRLALSCVMDVDAKGRVKSADVFESVINVNRRMTYDEVNEMITVPASPLRGLHAGAAGMIDAMNRLRGVLWEKRAARGAIELDFAEFRIEVDESGRPTDIIPHYRNSATNLIEEFMLLCNETIAERFFWAGLPFVDRTHEPPDGEKLFNLSSFAARFGYAIRAKTFSRDAQSAIAKSKGKPEEALINRMILRSMKQARYTDAPTGHFGLAARYYCHFTSPIRRFPDLQIHTIIKDYINGRRDFEQTARALPEICARCSITERRAEQAERGVDDIKKAQFMEDKIGQSFSGVISGVTERGIFVELPNTVEGLIPRSELTGDRFVYDRASMSYQGRKRGSEYAFGRKIRIVVAGADAGEGKVTFALEHGG